MTKPLLQIYDEAVEFNNREIPSNPIDDTFVGGVNYHADRRAPIDVALRKCLEALEMGTFHHPVCPYYYSKPCLCSHEKVDAALAELRKALEENK